jgi:hypothetical protein
LNLVAHDDRFDPSAPSPPHGVFSMPPLPVLPSPALIGRMSDRELLELCVRYLAAIPQLQALYEKVWIQQVSTEDRLLRLERAQSHIGKIASSAWRKWGRVSEEMKRRPDLPDVEDSQIIPPHLIEEAQKERYGLRPSDATFLRGARAVWASVWKESVKHLVTVILVSLAWMAWHLVKTGHALP